MRELDGVNDLLKPNTDYNKEVANAIRLAQQAINPRDLIDVLNKVKKLEDVTKVDKDKDKEIVIEGKTEDNIPEREEEDEGR